MCLNIRPIIALAERIKCIFAGNYNIRAAGNCHSTYIWPDEAA